MWIMTNWGVMSVVQRPLKSEGHVGLELQVRARDRKTLTKLRRLVPQTEVSDIIRTPDADYQYRVFISRWAYGQLLDRLVETLDYENFKNSVQDDDLHDLYIKIWGAIFRHYPRLRPRKRDVTR